MAKIPVVLCIDSRIILGTAVTIKSMLETAKPETTYDIRIFHSGLSASDEKNIQELVAGTRHELKLHYIDPARFDGAPRNKGSWTEIVYYRLLTPEILTEYDKAIYSDVDVLIKEDLSEAYNTDLEGYEIAAVPNTLNEALKDLQPERYFEENKNKYIYISSFIVFNNKLMREEKTVDKFFNTIKTFNSRLVFFDMDTLNITCNKVKNLPLKYCVFESLYEYTDVRAISEYKDLKTVYTDAEMYYAKEHPVIIHYAGRLGKPWQRKWVPDYYQEYIDKLDKKYRKYTFRDIRKRLLTKPKYPVQKFDVGLLADLPPKNIGACLSVYAMQEFVKSLGYSCAFVNDFTPQKKEKLNFVELFVNRYLKLMPKFNNSQQSAKLAACFMTESGELFPQMDKKQAIGNLNIQPLFLLDKNKLNELAGNSYYNLDNKIVSFFAEESTACSKLCEDISKQYKLEVCDISHLSVNDLIKAFIQAKYIITDNYYGVCVTLIYNKAFIALSKDKNEDKRFETLKTTFDITNGFIFSGKSQNYSTTFADQNWAHINSILEKQRFEAIKTLKCLLAKVIRGKTDD